MELDCGHDISDIRLGVGPAYPDSNYDKDIDFKVDTVFFYVWDGRVYLRGNNSLNFSKFEKGKPIIILYDGIDGYIRYFQNDIEKCCINLNNSFNT